ncbi:MAG: hypothetical protein RLN88_08280 [Ekhidna sp.]|uniref:hypothetical protein n=1 Tax=Ekhidna sp. TaxID=2608089 RepID=UPI0032ECD2C8
MSKKRIKISAAYNDFIKTINGLRSFDSTNQLNFNKGLLSKKQIHILSESCFFSAFREYENFVRDIFLLYAQGKKTTSGSKVVSYLNPIDFFHAEKMMQSSMPFLDWNSPDTVIERSELYLKDGYPIKTPYTTNRSKLSDYKKLRNHIAHNSTTSLSAYKKILRVYFRTMPLKTPSVGEYLVLTARADRTKYHLLEFFDLIEDMADKLK